MKRKLKPHVRLNIVQPLEKFYLKTVEEMRRFDKAVYFMSPSDGVSCIGFVKKAARTVRDAANDFVATADTLADRVKKMKETKRASRERD